MWSKHRTDEHTRPIRVYGPNAAREIFHDPHGRPQDDIADAIDAKYGAGLNAWLTIHCRAVFALPDGVWCWMFAAGSTLNITLLKRLLTVRTEWSRK
jgi:hypothetical protein